MILTAYSMTHKTHSTHSTKQEASIVRDWFHFFLASHWTFWCHTV